MQCFVVSLLLAVAITIANGLPNTFQCARYCKESPSSTFGYAPGKTYRYKYSGSATTTINPTNPSDTASVHLLTDAYIHVLDTCNFVLKVANTKLLNAYSTSSTPEEYTGGSSSLDMFKNLFERDVLLFSYQNGRIENICHSNDEPENILNIKRGILSSFQNSAQNIHAQATVYESDVTGNCETRYEPVDTSEEDVSILKKIKFMDRCNHRTKKQFSWQSVPYSQKQTKGSQPLLRSTQECVQKYNSANLLKISTCKESHKFQPFSYGSSGATSQVFQTMKLFQTLDARPNFKLPTNIIRSSLLYEETAITKRNTANLPDVISKLQKIEVYTKDGINEEVPLLFSELVHDFNDMENTELLSLFDQIVNNAQQKKIFLDAISLVRTANSIKVIIDLYNRNKLTTSQMISFIRSIGFISTPTIDTLENAKELLFLNEESKQSAFLAVSSLLYKFCAGDNSCYENDVISSIMDVLIKPVVSNNCIPTSTDNFDNILLSIKALGNAGLNTPMEALRTCYDNRNSPLQLRLAAIAAHSRIPCQFKMNNLDDFTHYLANPHEDTELRITSYLASMQCVSYSLFSQVKDILLHEETNQVGSFVWTHLTNLQESSIQWKQNTRRLLENDFLRNKFSTDLRKYSRNYEASTFFEGIGAGAGLEGNVIFTQDSYLPKSLMLNLTLDLFGESINLFEIGCRMEGLEDVIENIFGADGYFPEKSIQNLLQTVRAQHEQSAKEKIKALGDTFREQKTLKRDPNGLIYGKIFGSEVEYYRFKELSELSGQMMTPNDVIQVILKLFRENNVQYTKSLLLLNSSLKVPTVLGLPLEISAEATASFGLSVESKLDLKDLWSYKMAAEGKIYPSVSVAVVGNMIIHTPVNKCGLQSLSTLNSNTFIDGHIFINGGKVIDLKINMPKNVTDILRVESNIFVVHTDIVTTEYDILEPIQDASNNTYDWINCTGDNFSTVTGIEFCYSVKYVNASVSNKAPYFPLTGSFKFGMTVKKTDVFDSYDFQLKIQNSDINSNPTYSMSMYANTPNSLVNRRIKASYNLDYQQMSLNAKLLSPFASLEINSKLGDDINKYGFYLRTSYNEQEIISIQSTFKMINVDKLTKYEPYATVNFRRKEIAAVTGTISHIKDSQYNAELTLEGITKDPVHVVGEVSFNSENLDVKALLTSKIFNGKISGTFQKTPNSFCLVTSSLYNFNNTAVYEALHFTFRVNQLRLGTLSKDGLHIEFTSSEKPIYDTQLSLASQRSKMYFDSNGVFKIFGTTWETDQLLKYQQPKNHVDVAVMCSLTCKENGIDYRFVLAHNSSEPQFTVHALMQLNEIQRLETIIKYEEQLPEKRTGYVLLYYPQISWVINGTLSAKSRNTHNILISGMYENESLKRNIISMTGEFRNSSTAEKRQYTLTSAVDLPGNKGMWNTPWNLTTFVDASDKQFYCLSQFLTTKISYFSKIDWTDTLFYGNINKDTKNLVLVDTENNAEKTKFLIGVNLYQHFEIGMVLLKPSEEFNFKFYWDKDRDQSKKLTLDLRKDVIRGLYLMNLEYPNQIIGASVILLPTQVTMNVTWGVEVSKRLYLKVGNEIYENSGIWFGELETPFAYLEKQEFNAKYFVIANRFKVETNISWRDHHVNGILSGSRGSTNLTGHFQVTTTLKEIEKIGASINYGQRLVDNNPVLEGDAKFIYNDDEITGNTMWKNRGLNVDANLEIISSTNTIQPITSSLVIRNTDEISTMNSHLGYQGKNISAKYRFQNARSFIKIATPFQGIEETDFEYAVVVDRNELMLELTLNIFKQLNHGLILFNNTEHAMNVKLNLTSPMTGTYRASFKHCNQLGLLDEQFMVTHGDDGREITNIIISGSIIPLLDMHVLAHVKILNNTAALLIKNNRLPQISSDILLSWNAYDMASFLTVTQSNQAIHDMKWILRSSLLDNSIKCHYKKIGGTYTTSLNLLHQCDIVNTISINENYTKIQNNLSLITAANRYYMAYDHSVSLHNSIVSLNVTNNKEQLYTNLNYNYNPEVRFIDSANFDLVTSWHDPVAFYFRLGKENLSRYKPVVRIWLGSYYQFNVESLLRLDAQSSWATLAVNATNIIPINIEASYNFTQNRKVMEMSMKEDNLLVTVLLDVLIEKEKGYTQLDVTSNKYGNLTNSKVSYNLLRPRKEVIVDIKLPYIKREFELKSWMEKNSRTIDSTMEITTNIKNLEIVAARVLFAREVLSTHGFIQFKLSEHELNWNYNISEISLPNKLIIASDLKNDFYNESNFNFNLSLDKNSYSRTIEMTFNSYIYDIVSRGGYNFERNTDHNDNTRTKMKNYITIKCTEHKKLNLLDLQINMIGILHRTDTGGSIDTKFFSNMPNLENIEMITKYELVNDSYSINSDVRYLRHKYKFHHAAKLYYPNLEIVFNINSIDEPKKNINLIISGGRKKDKYSTTMEVTYFNKAKYTIVVDSAHNLSELYFDNDVTIITPVAESHSSVVLKGLGFHKYLRVNATLDGRKNEINWTLNSTELLDFSVYLYTNLEAINLIGHTISLQTDLNKDVKKIGAEYKHDTDDKYVFNAVVDSSNILLKMGVPSNDQFVLVDGEHYIDPVNITLRYNFHYNKSRYGVYVTNYDNEYKQTRLEFRVGNGRYGILETKMDEDKIRASLSVPRHYMSALVLRKAFFTSKDVIIIEYNGEPLLVVSSRPDQTIVTTTSNYGIYRLTISYTSFPRIWTFSILKNNDNFISLAVHDNSNDSHVDIKGRLMAPHVLTNYPSLSIQYKGDKKISNLLHFAIMQSNKPLIYIGWVNKEGPNYINSWFKFQSPIEFLQYFEQHLAFINTTAVGASYYLKTIRYDIQKEFEASFQLPKLNYLQEMKVNIVYPYALHEMSTNCSLNLHLMRSSIKFYWTSPFHDWKNLTIIAKLNEDGLFRNGVVNIERNMKYLKLNWSSSLLHDRASGQFDMNSNGVDIVKDVALNLEFVFYRTLSANCQIDDAANQLDVSFENTDLEKSVRASLISDSAYIEKGTFLWSYIHDLNATRSMSNIFTMDGKEIYNFNANRSSDDRSGDDSFKMCLNFDSARLMDYSVTYNLQPKYNKIILISMDGSFNTSPLIFIPEPVIFNFNVNVSIAEKEGYVKIMKTHKYQFAEYSPDEENVNSIHWLVSNNEPNLVTGELTFNNNGNLYNTFYRHRKNSTDFESNFKIFSTMRQIEILIGSHNSQNRLSGNVLIDTPVFEKILFHSDIFHDLETIDSVHELGWGSNERIQLRFNSEYDAFKKSLNLTCTTTFSEMLFGKMDYRKLSDGHGILLHSTYGQKEMSFQMILIPEKNIKAEIVTPFIGYTTGKFSASMDKSLKTVEARLEKENLLAEFNGTVDVVTNNIFEAHLVIKNPTGLQNETIANAVFKLDRENMKGFVRIYWVNDFVDLGLSYDPEELSFKLQSDVENIKNITLTGMYLNDVHDHIMKAEGDWNEIPIKFNGNLKFDGNSTKTSSKFKIGSKYEGEFYFEAKKSVGNVIIDFHGYYPHPQSNAYFKYDSFKNGSTSVVNQLVIKTPFADYSAVNINSKAETGMVSLYVIGNIARKDFASYNKIFRSNASRIEATASISIPSDETKWLFEGDFNATRNGVLRFYRMNQDVSSNATVSYERNATSLIVTFDKQTDDEVLHESLVVIQKSTPNIYYSISYGDYKALANIKYVKNKFNFANFVAKLSYNGIQEITLTTDLGMPNKEESFLALSYNNHSLKMEGQNLTRSTSNKEVNLNITSPLYKLEGKLDFKHFGDGFQCNIITRYADAIYSNMSLVYVNSDEVFEIISVCLVNDVVDTKQIITIQKDLDKIYISTNSFEMSYLKSDESVGYYLVCNCTDRHFVFLNLSPKIININYYTILLAEKEVKILLDIATNTQSLFVFYGDSVLLNAKIASLLDTNNENNKHFAVNASFTILDTRIYTVRSNVNISDGFKGEMVITDADKNNHTLGVVYHVQHHFIAGFDLFSHYLPDNGFAIQTHIEQMPQFTFHVGSSELDVVQRTLVHLVSEKGNQTYRLQADVPMSRYFKMVDLHVQWLWEDEYLLRQKLDISSEVIGQVRTLVDLVVDDTGLFFKSDMQLPFMENFETFHAVFELPSHFKPRFEITLPNGKSFGVHFLHNITSEVIMFRVGYICHIRKFDIDVDIDFSKYKIYMEAIIPSKTIKYVKVAINSIRTTQGHSNVIAYNDNIYELTHNIINNKEYTVLSLLFTTPHEGYDKYFIDLEWKIHPVKTIRAWVYYPDLVKPVGFHFIMSFHNAFTFRMNAGLVFPLPIYGVDYFELSILDELSNIDSDGVLYVLECSSNTNLYNISINVDAVDIAYFRQLLVGITMNQDTFSTNIVSIGPSIDDLCLSINLNTTYLDVGNVNIFLNSSVDLERGVQSGIIYNKEDIINFDFRIQDQLLHVIVKNLWKPVSLQYKYVNKYGEFSVVGVVCYNLFEEEKSTLGGSIVITNNITTRLYLPSRTMSFLFEIARSRWKVYYLSQLSWNSKDTLSLEVLFVNKTMKTITHLHHSAILQFPFHRFEVLQVANVNFVILSMNTTNKLIWGLEKSEISLQNKLEPGKLRSRLTITPLDNDIILYVDMSKFHNIPSTFKASLQYSKELSKLIELEMFYNKKTNAVKLLSTERKFILKHPASKINHTLYFNTIKTSQYTNGSTVIHYHNYELEQADVLKASICVWHERFRIKGDIETNQNTMSIGVEATNERDKQTLKLLSQVNDKEPLLMECIYDYSKASPSVNAKVSYGRAKRYDLYLGLPSNKEIKAHLQHDIYDDSYMDAVFTLKLNSSQLLWVKLQWANELLQTFHSAILEEYGDLRYIFEATGKQLIDILDDDIGKVLVDDLKNIKQNVSGYYEGKFRTVLDGRLTRYIISNYNQNAFYSKRIQSLLTYLREYKIFERIVETVANFLGNIYSTLKTTLLYFIESTRKVVAITSEIVEAIVRDISDIKRLKSNAKALLKNGIYKARQSVKHVEEIAVHLLDELNECVNNFRLAVEQFFDPCLTLLDEFIQYIEAQLTLIQIAVMDTIDKIQQYLSNLREMKEMIQVYIVYINWLEDLHISTILEPIGDVLEKILDTIIRDVTQTFAYYKPYIEALTEATFGNYDGVKSLPQVTEVKETMNQIYQRTIWIWNHNNMTDLLKNSIHKMSADLDDCLAYILDYDNSPNNDFEYVVGQAGYMIKPEAGIIEIAQPLPVEWEAFDKWPKFEQHYAYKKIMRKVEQLEHIFRYRYGDIIQVLLSYVDDLRHLSLSLPINNVAMIAGRSHIITFNGKHYDFVGEHSYLLASDFVYNSFSIVINYKMVQSAPQRHSLTVHIKDQVLEICPNYTVMLDYAKSNLPIILDDGAYVLRDKDNIIIEYPKKFRVHCNMRFDYCVIQLTGWLFGKTAGLLGTMDNEVESDMLLPNGTRTKDLDEFTESWRIRNQLNDTIHKTDTRNNSNKVSPLQNLLVTNICSLVFEDRTSPLFHCFQKVDPKPFYKFCVSHVKDDPDPNLCVSIAVYKELCWKEKIILEIPHVCRQCEANGNTIGGNEELIFDGNNPKSVDVIFIKQTNCENENYDLSNLPTILDNSFNTKGFIKNRFAFVSYGGDILSKPYISTSNSQIWTNARLMQSSEKFHFNNDRPESVNLSAISVINYATDNLNFRPGVITMIILLHCSKTLEIQNTAKIFTKLSDKDVILHVLKSKPFIDQQAQVLGLNSNGYVINMKATIETTNRTDAIIDNLRDMHNELALGTNGTVADIDGFIERPNFGDSWASLVSQSLRRSPCQRCRCTDGADSFGKIECVRCISPAVKRFMDEYELRKPKFSSDNED